MIDRDGLHRTNLRGLRDGARRLPAGRTRASSTASGSARPRRRTARSSTATTKSAAIAAASIVAKVTRDRYMRRVDALYPHYGFSSHVGYITPGHSAVVRERGPVARSTAARSGRSATG